RRISSPVSPSYAKTRSVWSLRSQTSATAIEPLFRVARSTTCSMNSACASPGKTRYPNGARRLDPRLEGGCRGPASDWPGLDRCHSYDLGDGQGHSRQLASNLAGCVLARVD